MMEFLTETGTSLTEILDLDEAYYNSVKQDIAKESKSNHFFELLDFCREFSRSRKKGYVILRYLLYSLRNKIIEPQMSDRSNNWISYLYLQNGCLPFESMPYAASPLQHNPPLLDLFACISSKGREHELLEKKVKNNTEEKARLFTPVSELRSFGNIEQLVQRHNAALPDQHKQTRALFIEDDKIYIKEYVTNTVEILKNLSDRLGYGLKGYSCSVTEWMENNTVDSEEKRKILKNLFDTREIAFVYGAAGTGKTTLIKHIASYFSDAKKLFLAYTHPAKEHLRRQIKVANSEFSTVSSSRALIKNNKYDIVFIDECSTIDNRSMKELLENLNSRLLVLVGDTYQIQSIRFGNWFGLAQYFMPTDVVYELKTPYRSKNQELIRLWDKVRDLDDKITEYLGKKHFTYDIDENIFSQNSGDRIILCLNYDGLYGVNNLNRFLQSDNPNKPVYWDTWVYKVNDPIVFNEFNRFYPTLYNNLKGWIRNIEKSAGSTTFEIEIDMSLTEFDVAGLELELLDCDVPGHSLIRFSVDSFVDDDEKERNNSAVVPFQVAYAVSIHKAQGLEYDYVKVIITNQIEEMITHNIFYTAITRAKKELKIYWTPETQQTVLDNLEPISYKRDADIIPNKFGLPLSKV